MPKEALGKEAEVAEHLGVQPATLRQWRWRGWGPRYVKVGGGTRGFVRYRWSDVDAYVNAQTREAA